MRCERCLKEITSEEKKDNGCIYCDTWEWIPIDQLKINDKNPRRMTRVEMNKLVRNIKEFGFTNPIIVNTNPERHMMIIAGHQRREAFLKIGKTEIPINRINLSPDREHLLNISDNEISGDWDDEKLFNLLKDLSSKPIDMTLSGFDEAFIDEILSREED